MAKTKKQLAAAFVVPPEVEAPSEDETVAKSAPESAGGEKAATDGSLHNNEEARQAGDLYHLLMNDEEGEEMNYLVDMDEEFNDALDKSEGRDKEEDITDDLDELEGEELDEPEEEQEEELEEEAEDDEEDEDEEDGEDEEEEEEKEEGYEEIAKPVVKVDNEKEKVDEEETEGTGKNVSMTVDNVPEGEEVVEDKLKEDKGNGKGEVVPTVNTKRMRKIKKAASGDLTKGDAGRKIKKAASGDLTKGDAGTSSAKKENVKGDATTSSVKNENAKGDAGTSSVKKKKAKGDTGATSVKKENAKGNAGTSSAKKEDVKDDAGTSAAEKKDAKNECMGLIFICNKKTKNDCFQYKVFGLPESRKDMVAKAYKGMRLFLFDVDLKLLYGIYQASSPGGYNIEPKAFKSKYPCQVRFSVLNDCLPLPEEKFRGVLKANYYGKNKFNCKLSEEQVNGLCKLFQNTATVSKEISSRKAKKVEIRRANPELTARPARRLEPMSSSRGRKRPRLDDPAPHSRDRKRAHRDELPARPARREMTRSSLRESRRESKRHDRIFSRGRDLLPPRRREAYDSSPPRPLPVPPPPASYSYDRPLEEYYLRRDPLPLELRRDDYRRAMDLEPRALQPQEYREPYSLYRDPLSRQDPLSLYAPSTSVMYAPPPLPPPSTVYAPPPSAATASLPSSYAPQHMYYRY